MAGRSENRRYSGKTGSERRCGQCDPAVSHSHEIAPGKCSWLGSRSPGQRPRWDPFNKGVRLAPLGPCASPSTKAGSVFTSPFTVLCPWPLHPGWRDRTKGHVLGH